MARTPRKNKARARPEQFPAAVGEGATIASFNEHSVIFMQGDAANALFYIRKGKVKLAVVSSAGKEAIIAVLGAGDFFGEGCLAGQPSACLPRPQ
jgi:CRP/FNR family transcriptional regulator, cyclic AMP receptor protein